MLQGKKQNQNQKTPNQELGLGDRRPGFCFQFCCELAELWTSPFPSLASRFFLCKMQAME